jgi:hypothetical protein
MPDVPADRVTPELTASGSDSRERSLGSELVGEFEGQVGGRPAADETSTARLCLVGASQPGQPRRLHSGLTLNPQPIPAYYYVSMAGDDLALTSIADNLGFSARVFKKGKRERRQRP